MDKPQLLLDRMELEERVKKLAIYTTLDRQALLLADDALTVLHHIVSVYEQERSFLYERLHDAEISINNGHSMLRNAFARIAAERNRADKVDLLLEQNNQLLQDFALLRAIAQGEPHDESPPHPAL